MFPSIPGYFYYISPGLQAICVFHRNRKGTQQKWIWLIVFLPYIGCIAYFFSEIVTGRHLHNWQSGIGSLFSPVGRISRLEDNLRWKIYQRPQFARSEAHVLYAQALEYTGDPEGAEKEFRKMKARFSYFGARHQYGMFLLRSGRRDAARLIFEEIVAEASHLSSRERRDSSRWIIKTKEELKKI